MKEKIIVTLRRNFNGIFKMANIVRYYIQRVKDSFRHLSNEIFGLRRILVLFSFFACITSCTTDNSIINFNLKLEGKRYDSLTIKCVTGLTEDCVSTYSGKTTDGFNWHFTIPKDTCERLRTIRIFDPIKNASLYHNIVLYYINSAGDTIMPIYQEYFNLETINTIDLKFLETKSFPEKTLLTNRGYVGLEADIFIISEPQIMKLLKDIMDLGSPLAYNLFPVEYDEDIKLQIQGASENPDNALMMKDIYYDLYNYKTKEDVRKVYEKFSTKNKNSYYGSKIRRYIDAKFENHNLLSVQTGEKEPVLQDSSKFNLIIFSASWCAPCIASIPKYKKIYDELGDKVILTYISEDKPNDIEKWKQLTEKYDIKWRSLLALDELEIIQDKYFAKAIPYALLVYPNRNMEHIKLFTQEDMNKFYQIVNQ
jgi:thiol-disulfide isomerase/thioredoxin